MSVRPMVKNGLNTVSPAEMIASKQEFVAYKESCRKLINIQTRELGKGKKITTSPKLIKGQIKFAQDRLEKDKMLSRILEERFSSSNNKEIHISKIVAKIAQREMKTVETSQTL